jgi:cysteinyl-tRNA synthetase
LEQRCFAAMNDDLNTPVAIAELFEGVRIINLSNDGKLALSGADIGRLRAWFDAMVFQVLGLKREEGGRADDALVNALVQEFVRLRAEAKGRKDFATSDAIRERLAGIGILLKDTKEGTTWERA